MKNKMKNKTNNRTNHISVDFLKKQRDGLIIGEYRNILHEIFQSILSKANYNKCCYLSEIPEFQNGSILPLGILFSYCKDLEMLGYINIIQNNNDYKLIVEKDMDF